ncbi:MAG: type II secretion system F family protein, partial [Thermodesulfobacteriota bacterium]
LILAILIAMPWVLSKILRKPGGKAFKDRTILRLPLLGKTVKRFYLSTMLRTLGSLLHSGVPLLSALDMTSRVLNHSLFHKVFSDAVIDVTEGGDLSKSFSASASNLIPGMIVHMTAIGERSGNLPEMLLRAADSYEREFNTSVERGLALMEPLLILIMGAAVGFIVLAILLPIFELNQIVR